MYKMFQIQTNLLGCFLIKDKKIISYNLFSKSSKEIACDLIYAQKNLLPEEYKIIEELEKSYKGKIFIKNCERVKSKNFAEISPLKSISLEEICDQIVFDKNELRKRVREINIEITKEEMRVCELDKVAIRLISIIDELNKNINSMNEQLREYYGMYFPEIDAISDHEIYASIAALGNRKNLDMKEINLSEKIKEKIKDEGKTSFGIELGDKYIKLASLLAKEIMDLYKLKTEYEENLKNLMNETAPNLTYLAGHMLAARLITLAGSLKNLAFMPASTIQMLGAEKALFKFLRTKKLPPKHGIIYTLPVIEGAQKKYRGKISRNFAAKISIAAKADYFKGGFIGKKLKEKFDKFVENLKDKTH